MRFFASAMRLLFILWLAMLPMWARSQSQLAAVSGTITDKSGAVVLRARVVIVNQGTGLERNTATDTAGIYHFFGLPPGTYTIRAEDQGFQAQVRESVALVSGSESVIDFSLTVGNLRQQVTVNSNASDIDSTTSTVSGFVAERSLANLPLNNRDLFSAVALVPGVAPDPSSAPSLLSSGKVAQVAIDGIRPSMTNVLIDGMDATDPVWGFSPAGASGFFLGLNELSEVRVLTQTFNAEYGGHGGAVIEMITRSGGNQFHGSMWELNRNASLDAKNYFDLGANSIPPFVRNQFGASIGGAAEAGSHILLYQL
ncbi:MAG: carboxypeptidase regulatory-like domain-containing protein [Acidobacteriaceae bacterium]